MSIEYLEESDNRSLWILIQLLKQLSSEDRDRRIKAFISGNPLPLSAETSALAKKVFGPKNNAAALRVREALAKLTEEWTGDAEYHHHQHNDE